MFPNRRKLVIVAVLAVAFGSVMLYQWFPRFAVRNAPIVTGRVENRTPTKLWPNTPGVDFTIAIENSDVRVHALCQKWMWEKVPETVKFHYTGDPAREVYLFEHEENPLWIALFCYGLAIVMGVLAKVLKS